MLRCWRFPFSLDRARDAILKHRDMCIPVRNGIEWQDCSRIQKQSCMPHMGQTV